MRTAIDKDAVLGHLQRHAGEQFDASAIARRFGVPHRTMWNALDALRKEGRIQNEDAGNGRPGRWFVPTEPEQAKPVPVQPYRMKPLSASNLPDMDYNRRRPGSGDLLRVPSKHI